MKNRSIYTKKKNNIRTYYKYEPFAWDLLFYYAIQYLFLTSTKNINSSQVLLISACYISFKLILQIPCHILVQKYGKKKMITLGNFSVAINILFFIFAHDFIVLCFAEIFLSLGFNLKDMCESDLLYDSISNRKGRGKRFAKIEGQTNSMYYIIDVFASIISGFLYVINPYYPMILCLIVILYCFFRSFQFEEIHPPTGETESVKKQFKEIRYSLKELMKSARIRSLIIFDAIFMAMYFTFETLRNMVLLGAGIKEENFGILFALLPLIGSISAYRAEDLHNRFRNRTLTYIVVPFSGGFFMSGILLFINMNSYIKILLAILLVLTNYMAKGAYFVLIKKYLKNFTDSNKRERIASIKSILDNLFSVVSLIIASRISTCNNDGYTVIVMGGIFFILTVLHLDRMRKKVGKEIKTKER